MTTQNNFETRYGFARNAVTLDNWRTHPFNRWSFQNTHELVPSAHVCSQSRAEAPVDPGTLLSERIGAETVKQFLDRSWTDALVVMKRGAVVADWRAPHVEPDASHLIFSISKSLTAILAGTLEDEGRLDPIAPVTDYVTEAAGSAYGDCTVRNVLDMRVALDFTETYLDPQSAFARYRRATLWNPGFDGETLLDFIVGLKKKPGAEHGGPFRYLSPNSDMLGVIVERASGRRIADLLRERLLGPVGGTGRCTITVDSQGTARTAGGMSMTARDLARIGEMMRNGGTANGKTVVSRSWVTDATTAGDREAWKKGDFPFLFENGSYRSKWYQSGNANGAFCAIGIHGQWLYVDPLHEVVIVKQSSQPLPVDDPLDLECLKAFEAIAAIV